MEKNGINMGYKTPELTLGVVFDEKLYVADSPTTGKEPKPQ